MKIMLWQTAPNHDQHSAVAALAQAAEYAKQQAVDLVLAPEMTIGGYNVGADRCEHLAANSAELIEQIANISRHHGIALVVGLALPGRKRPFNSAIAFDATGQELGRYHKTHLYGEVDRTQFSAGEAVSDVFELLGWKIGLAICYDIEFPEVARALAVRGADLILVPTANMVPFDSVSTRIVPARAQENGLFVAYANYIGVEAQFTYNGLSCVCGPDGCDLARADGDTETMLFADLDKDVLEHTRKQLNYLNDRRPALYDNTRTEVFADE